jgi:hypothetical protein
MSWLTSFLNPGKGYDKAQEELNKYWQQAQQFQQPFMNNAQGVYGGLNEAFQNLLDPSKLQDMWSKNYKESDYAKNMEHELMDRGLNSAQSMGLGGSSSALQALQGGTQKVVNDERQKFLDDLMKKYMTGIGLGENIYGTGANAAGNLSNQAMHMGEDSAQMAFGKENAPGDLLSRILQGGVSFATPFAQAWGMNKMGMGGNTPWSTVGGR